MASVHVHPKRVRADQPGAGGPRGGGGVERVVHRHILCDRHDRADTGGGAGRYGVAHAFGRGVEHRHVRPLGKIGDAVKERQSVHGLAAAPERDAADQRRAGGDQPRHLVAGVAAGRIDHRHPPWLGVEKRQALEDGCRHASVAH
jgi:hypothetical protein